jgi:hypothetical protein
MQSDRFDDNRRASVGSPWSDSPFVPEHERTDNTQISVTIWSGDAEWVGARGVLDTGCKENWVTWDIVKRIGIQEQIEKFPRESEHISFDNHPVVPMGRCTITWYANKAAKTRVTDFLIAERDPYDCFLGKTSSSMREFSCSMSQPCFCVHYPY